MRQWLIDFLKEAERLIPPPENCHHAITYAQHGSNTLGWTEKLAFQVNKGGEFFCFFLDPDDMDMEPAKLARIVAGMLDVPDPAAQRGVALGHYIPNKSRSGMPEAK